MNNLGNSIPRNGLVLEILGDGNVLNTSTYPITTANTSFTFTGDYIGYQKQVAYNASSSTAQILITNTAVQELQTFTWTGWIYPTTASTTFYKKNGYPSFNIGYSIIFTEGGTYFNQQNGSAYTLQAGSISGGITLKKWNFITAIKTPTSWTVYINSELKGSISAPTVTYGTASSKDTWLFKNPETTAETSKGKLCLFRLFSYALSFDEIKLMYLEGLKKLGPTNIPAYPKLLSGLVGYWDFKGTAHNLVDGTLATVTGATLTTDRFGNSNSAYNLNGTSNYIQSTPTYTFSNNEPTTIAIWVKIINNPSGQSKVCVVTNPQQIMGVIYYDTSGGLQYLRTTNVGDSAYTSSYQINLANTGWRLIGFTKSTNCQLYLDGNTIGTASTWGTSTGTRVSYITIGKDWGASFQYFNGDVGETFVFNRELSADEFNQLYKLTSKDYIYPAPSYDLLSLRDGLIIDINEQGKDLSGNGNNATLINAPVVSRQGKLKLLNLNGTNQRLEVPMTTNLGGDFSVNIWVNFSTSSTNQAIIEAYVSSYNNYWFNIAKTNTNMVSINLYDGVNNPSKTSTITVTSGVWYMITLVRDTTIDTLEGFINGVSFGSVTDTTTLVPNYSKINIGYWQNPNIFLSGKIGKTKIYNAKLTTSKIQALYYSQKGNFIY